MQMEDKVVKSFDMNSLIKITRLPLICIYNSPSDYPGKYVARLWWPKNKQTAAHTKIREEEMGWKA